MPIKTKSIRALIITSQIALLGLVGFVLLRHSPHVKAAGTITVNSTADDSSNDGECTLREAITSANTDTASGAAVGECAAGSGIDTINFAITGTADFTNGGQNGYTIEPQSTLPAITAQVTINGYSQPGAQANTAIAPNPLNGRLLIEIDGNGAGSSTGLEFGIGSDNSRVSGVVVNSFSGTKITVGADNIQISGNYVGINPAGTLAKATGSTSNGINHNNSGAANLIVGGLNPQDRNLISGNTGSGITPNSGDANWTIQGNFIGLAADGVSAIPNSSGGAGEGSISLDNSSGHVVGGSAPGAINVISGNTSYGIAPDNAPNAHIIGNYIGTDWTGTVAVPNLVGVILGNNGPGTVIGGSTSAERNIISGNTLGGIISGITTGSPQISGNYIGLNKTGMAAIPNGVGVLAADSSIVGGSVANRNVISGNSLFNVSVQGLQTPSSGAEVSGNYIGTNASGDIDSAITALQGEGVRVSANTTDNIIGGEIGNVIAGNRGAGVSVRSLAITQFGVTATPAKTAILGNQIYGNEAGGSVTGAPGLGIDLYKATVNTLSFPADLQADSYVDLGVNANDSGDPDTGPNGYINFPVLNSVVQSGTQATVNFDLDAADSPTNQYRVEFFANDAADASGHGEGQTYLGSTTVANGNNQQASITLPNNINLTGKSISATTTAVDGTTSFGFGGTSEFSAGITAQVASIGGGSSGGSSGSSSGSLAGTGQTTLLIVGVASLLILSAGTILSRRTR